MSAAVSTGPPGERLESTTRRVFRATARFLLDVLLPWTCAGCGRQGREVICGPCRERVRWISGFVCSTCGLPLASGPVHRCGRCLERPPAFRRARAVASYRAAEEADDPLGIAIRALKYAGRRPLAGPLSALLADRFPFDRREVDLLIPVPLHLSRLRVRGFNQALLLAREPSRRFGIPVEARGLVRIRPTPPQVGLGEAERRRNLRGAFAVRPGVRLRGRRVLLIDDVATSTATADACATVLRSAGADSVDVLTLARTLPH